MTIFEFSSVIFNGIVAVGAIFAFYEFYANRSFNRDLAAKSTYLDYVNLSLSNPSLANPHLVKIDCEAREINGDKELFEKYEWYVAYMITTFEEIITLSDSEAWYKSITGNLVVHKTYFTSNFFESMGYKDNINSQLWGIILNVFPELLANSRSSNESIPQLRSDVSEH